MPHFIRFREAFARIIDASCFFFMKDNETFSSDDARCLLDPYIVHLAHATFELFTKVSSHL